MKKLKFILVGIALLISTVTTAQDNFFAITYNTALTTGETNDFISKYSWGAMGLEWKNVLFWTTLSYVVNSFCKKYSRFATTARLIFVL